MEVLISLIATSTQGLVTKQMDACIFINLNHENGFAD